MDARRSKTLAGIAMLLAGCSSTQVDRVQNWGTVHEALGQGQTAARVRLSDVATTGFWAVGALSELRGEITIADGETWTSVGAASGGVPQTRTGSVTDPSGEAATILFGATVVEWSRHTVEQAVEKDRVAEFIADVARAKGFPREDPFMFRIEGPLREVSFHVIAGQCPIRARMHGEEITSPPYHERARNMRATIVGVYATHGSGVFAHGGKTIHAHIIRRTKPAITGHVEAMALDKGAVLYLPKTQAPRPHVP